MRISDWSSDVCSSDLSERCLRNLRNILAIDQNAPGLHIIEAEEQARDGRLACARRPHDGKRLPRRNVDVETVKDFPICSVDRKSTRLTTVTNAHLVCRLLLEKKKTMNKDNRNK